MRDLAAAVVARAIGIVLLGGAVACGSQGRLTDARSGERPPVACPHDARKEAGTCRCAPGLSVLEGACVGPREIAAYCGVAGVTDVAAVAGGQPSGPGPAAACAFTACADGDPLDLTTRTCVPARMARAVLARARPIPEDLVLACHDGDVLVVHGEDVSCLPSADTCPRTRVWNPATARCVPLAPCNPGEIREERAIPGACARIVSGTAASAANANANANAANGASGALVDVGRWTREMLGADRGPGTSRLCQPFVEQPWTLDVGTGGARALALSIELRFPDNDVTQVSGSVRLTDAASGQPVLGGARRGQRDEQALESLLVPLRALGGTSDAASATLQVRCAVRGGGTPFLVPGLAPARAKEPSP